LAKGQEKGETAEIRHRFSREFKLEAVKRLEAGDKPATQLAMELGIRRNMLLKWREQLRAKGERAFGGAGRPLKSEQSELARLKAELARVTEERDILKKAAAYFAKRRR
jgi:transposase